MISLRKMIQFRCHVIALIMLLENYFNSIRSRLFGSIIQLLVNSHRNCSHRRHIIQPGFEYFPVYMFKFSSAFIVRHRNWLPSRSQPKTWSIYIATVTVYSQHVEANASITKWVWRQALVRLYMARYVCGVHKQREDGMNVERSITTAHNHGNATVVCLFIGSRTFQLCFILSVLVPPTRLYPTVQIPIFIWNFTIFSMEMLFFIQIIF